MDNQARSFIWIVIACVVLLLVVVRGGSIDIDTPLQAGARVNVPGPTNQEQEIVTSAANSAIAPVAPHRAVTVTPVGVWDGWIEFDFDGNPRRADVRIEFLDSGTYTIAEDTDGLFFDPGSWIQQNKRIAWRSASDTYYEGRMSGDVITGQADNPSGRFYLRRAR